MLTNFLLTDFNPLPRSPVDGHPPRSSQIGSSLSGDRFRFSSRQAQHTDPSARTSDRKAVEQELVDPEVVISQPFWPAYLTAERISKASKPNLAPGATEVWL